MAGSQSVLVALHTLQYLSPIAVLAYFFIATFISVWKLAKADPEGDSPSHRLRRLVSACLGVHILLYLAQAVLVVDLIFSKPGLYGSDPTNINALSSSLVWIVITTCILTFEGSVWYPYYGSWLLALATQIVILALSLTLSLPSNGPEWALVSAQSAQILLLLFLSATFFAWTALKKEQQASDEERTPLLAADGVGQQGSNTTGANQSNGSEANATEGGTLPSKDNAVKAADDDHDDSDSDSDSDSDDSDDEDYWTREEARRKAKIKKRLKEEGGWMSYLKSFSVFLPYIWPARDLRLKLHLLGVVICMIAGRILNPLEPLQLGYLVDYLTTGDIRNSFTALGLYVFLNFAESNVDVVRSWLWLPIETNTAARMEKASYNHIMDLSCDFHDSKRTGEVFEAMRQGQSVVDLIETVGFSLIPEVADLFIACAYFYFLFDAYMVLIGLGTGILYVCISAWITAQSGDRRRELNSTHRQKSQIKYDTVNGWKTVSYFNRVPDSQQKFGGALDRANEVFLSYRFFWTYMSTLQSAVLDLGRFCACVLAVYQILYQGKRVGNFVTLMSYWGNLTGPMISLSHTSSGLFFDLVDAEALLRIWKKKPAVSDGPNELSLQDGHVRFEDVGFKYDAKKGTIDELSFEAKPGQTIALVGETGAGKSTILKLIFRFYDVTSGKVTIDGQDVRDVTLQSLRENIGVVPQDPSLFNVSIIENLRFAKLDATDDEIYEACKAAAVHDKIMSFAKGYQSKVGERGVKLSGGELQRVAIARAILKNPPIVLLDEATSSVDSETEAKIQEGLKRLCYNRTTFVVAHRLSTIQHADQILVIKDGKILEKGTPAELLEQKGKYHSLWTRQMGIFDPFTLDGENKDKKDKENDDSSEGTRTAEVDLIDLKGDLRDPAKAKELDEALGKKAPNGDEADATGVKVETADQATQGQNTEVGTKDDNSAVPPSPTKSASHFRPDAPEFVPIVRRSDSRSESNAEAAGALGSSRPPSRASQTSNPV